MRAKKIIAILLLFTFALPMFGCDNKSDEGSKVESEASAEPLVPSEKAAAVWKSEWADSENGFADASTIYGFDFYKNRQLSDANPEEIGSDDCKYIFYGDKNARIVNFADGYTFTLPTKSFTTDYKLSALRTRYQGDDFLLTVSKENKSPYGNTENGWQIYSSEWLIRFIDDLNFLSKNNIRRTRAKVESTDMLEGYTVWIYNMQFSIQVDWKYQYYDIAVVRKNDVYDSFYLFVMKSSKKQVELLDSIVKSFTEIAAQGKAANDPTPYELKIPDYWSSETKAYYEQLQKQTSVSWGVFKYSMPDDKSSTVDTQLKNIIDDQARLEDAFDYQLDIMPTYTALAWGENYVDFPTKIANQTAGGNGFNGKPVLQFTYQFTTQNNTNLNGYSPMFGILKGEYDKQFRKLAQQIKAYGKPVLFRLNNEMNTDWTSYCGMITLLDPDIFIETWQRLYRIFREEGVDNCIWIFNPIAKTCPYSNWGEALCYMPGTEYMQLLGLTHYEMNNGQKPESFKNMYTYVYNQSAPYFNNYPWIISEFACGSGGEAYYDYGKASYVTTTLGRNKASQAEWVKEMFKCLNNNQSEENVFCKNIKAAVWFSANDYAAIDGKQVVINYLQLDNELTDTLAAFKEGLAANKKN
jgi:hypothetical protein